LFSISPRKAVIPRRRGANNVPYGRGASGVYTVSYLVLLCLKISNTFIDLSTHQVEENPGNDRLNVNGARTYES